MKRFLEWIQRLLFAGGAAMILYCGFILLSQWLFQKQERDQLEQLLAESTGRRGQTTTPALPLRTTGVVSGGLLGRLEIARLGISVMVVEGTSIGTLRRAAGHIPGTSLPGGPGNVGISAHRDTFFRPLRNIRSNDIITVTTLSGEYRYRVVSTKVVTPDDVAVLGSSPAEVLTLITCHPFYFIGPAAQRFIVRAERIRLSARIR